jgi:hypothetical protein
MEVREESKDIKGALQEKREEIQPPQFFNE